jgi:sugar O-acyltransferase (sialic acid O-acetyltransferase NeuD family)
MSKRLILVGCGDFGRELINWADDAAASGVGQSFFGFLDNNPTALDKYSYKLAYLGSVDDFLPNDEYLFIIGIANPETKRIVVEKLKAKGAVFTKLVHPSAVIARTAILGEGVVICPHALISADASLGNFVAVNGLSSIGHDAHVGHFSTLSAHVDITGFAHIGEGVFFGTGAKVLPKVKIGNGARIGAGTTIMRSVSEGDVMYALPAKRL